MKAGYYWFDPSMCLGFLHEAKKNNIDEMQFTRIVKYELEIAQSENDIKFVLDNAAAIFPEYRDKIEKLIMLL